MTKTIQTQHGKVGKKKGENEMKKNLLYLIIVPVVLMLAGLPNIGQAFDSQESQALVSAAFPRSDFPDYFADGKFFTEEYLHRVPAGNRQVALDYRLDAEFFNAWYRDVSASHQNKGVIDYPLDGKLYKDMFLQSVPAGARPDVPDYPADAKVFYESFSSDTLSSSAVGIPDYPLDGKLFIEEYVELP
jgi:hypothetical protein